MRRRHKQWLLLVVLVLFINLPIVHSTWLRHRVETSGTEVTSEVVGGEVLGGDDDPQYWVHFRLPEDVDPAQATWPVQVDSETYDAATASSSLEVRVLPDNPSAYSVEGEVRSSAGLAATAIADLILLVVLLLFWRFRGRRRPAPLRIAAIGDVERCPPGGVLEQVEGLLYIARGEVVGIEPDEIVLDTGERDVVVVLDGHQNPVGYQQPAQVRGRLVD